MSAPGHSASIHIIRPKLIPDPSEEYKREHPDWDKEAPDERDALIAKYFTVSDEAYDPDTLPPRPWIGAPYLMRGELTLLHGPGGAGKSTIAIHWAVALALGVAFGKMRPTGNKRYRVLLPNFEDGELEQKRRIAAALKYFGKTPADLVGWLFRVTIGADGDATMFVLDQHGQITTTECWDAFAALCDSIKPDVILPDPLVAINGVPENNNTLQRRVMILIRTLCRKLDAAGVPIHHDNKASTNNDDTSSDATSARGGGDITNAARIELATKKMSPKQASDWGLDPKTHGRYFRVGSASSKINYAALEDSEWFERLEEPIGGHATVRCIPWTPPAGKLNVDQTAIVLAAIEKGTKTGPYSAQIGNTDRSLEKVMESVGITSARVQATVLKDLLRSDVVSKAKWRVPGHGNKKLSVGLRAANGEPSKWDWQDDEP